MSTLEFEIKRHLNLDVSFIWDYLQNPQTRSDGAIPQKSDYYLTVGFGVAAVVWGIALPWWDWPVDRLVDPEIALRVLGVGVVGTLIPFLLAVSAVRIISAAVAGIAATTEPVFASALAWLLLGQALGLPQLVGGGLVVVGVVLAQLARTGVGLAGSAAVEVAP